MSDFFKITRHTNSRRPERRSEKSYSWQQHLHAFEKGKASFVAADAFSTNLLVDCNDSTKEGIVFELTIHDHDKSINPEEHVVRWFAISEKVCGYRILARFIGCSTKFWINSLSDDIFSVGHASRNPTVEYTYSVPLPINIAYQKNIESFIDNAIENEMKGQKSLQPNHDEAKKRMETPRFRVGQRLELLNYQKSTEIRVARVQATCGRRINVLVTKRDFPGTLPKAEDDRQVHHSGAQYWIDEGSFFIFPVGFAAVNGYPLNARKEYIEHTNKIAEAIRSGKEPKYEQDDIKFEDLPKEPVDPEKWSKLKKGQKFELIDPLAQQFKNLHVASILDFLTTDGYLIVGMDGPDALEDSFPIHINNPFMFPVNYSKEHNLELVEPDEFEGEFEWTEYLKGEGAEPLPLELFKPEPEKKRLGKFKVGMRLEAADMCENHFICPATITSVHGRILNVNFDGWDEEFDELYDIDSHDILPIGWCEYHDYTLQEPRKVGSSQ